ncbi:hypothetical protein ILUMI_27328 [Ignelater luminosus]|uniref:Luciferin 4-monooxygenase n=1 Tax=Ignelater luminosus TaxID=2038154 RepID=A0A8K0C4P2_IGNLU|nr:hypothetical protein ILUMI_27328 [Ignelater luminosus]
MLLKKLLKNLPTRNFNNSYYFIGVLQIRRTSSASEPNVVRSKAEDINIPDVFLEEYLWNGLNKWHDKVALVCAETGRKYSYSELHRKAIALSNCLHNFPKLKQNDTVAVILPNVPEYPIITIGAIQAGLKITPINPIFTSDEIQKQILTSEAKLIFTLNEFWPKVNQAVKAIADVPIVVINHQQNQPLPPKAIQFDEISKGESELSFRITKSTDDVILLPYSSGTTGLPKGVQLTNKSLVSNLYQMTTYPFKLFEDAEGSHQEVIPCVLPLFHIYGHSMAMLNMLSTGCKLVTIPKFGPQIFLNVLKEHRPTFGYLVPPIVLFLLNDSNVRSEYITQMRTIICGAAPLGAADLERFTQKTNGKAKILQAYGLTEASPLTHSQTKHIDGGDTAGGCGYSLPNTECKIVALDDDIKTGLGCNQSGELLIRGPQVMKGYHKNPKATEEVLDSNGWLRTGDIGHYNEDGHFFVTDRLKELIKVKGFQVAPAELEELIRDHPDVEDAAVVGVPHPDFGEVPKAFVVPRKNVNFSGVRIQEYVASKAAKYKHLIGGVVTIGSIPKTASGKILRRQLKQL